MEKRMFLLGYFLASACFSHASLQFTATRVNDEQAIQLRWKSETNGVYRIEFLNELQDSNNTWKTLYEDYPAHGTNTLWLDTGDYLKTPIVHHPKRDLTRFYRVVQTGTNNVPVPAIALTAPLDGAVASGLLTNIVSFSTGLPVRQVLLFVDGEEVESSTGTNFVINTCEWPNGEHTIFAILKADSGMETSPGDASFKRTYAVSPYVTVNFNNFVSKVQFSEAFFEPSLGQIQTISAQFPTNSAIWTLNIRDAGNNIIRTASGNGTTMSFDWDGKDNTGLDIPNGIYRYEITGAVSTVNPSIGSGDSPPPPSPPHPGGYTNAANESFFSSPTADGLFVDYWLFYPPAPPGMEQQPAQIQRRSAFNFTGLELATELDSLVPFPTWPQTTTAPTRTPIAPVKGNVGKIGIAYFSYGPNGASFAWPRDGLPGPINSVTLNDNDVANPIPLKNFITVNKLTERFARTMTASGWKLEFNKHDGDLLRTDLIRSDLNYGGANLFNQVNLGLFVSHGFYGSSVDYTPAASQSYQTYFPMGGNNPPNTWLRMSEFRFGGNLRWMAILACDGLRMFNAESMKNKGVLPIGDTFHFMMSGGTTVYLTESIGKIWAEKMLGAQTVPDETVLESWYAAGVEAYQNSGNIPITVTFSSAGWDSTISDRLSSYFEPDPESDNLFYDERIIYTP